VVGTITYTHSKITITDIRSEIIVKFQQHDESCVARALSLPLQEITGTRPSDQTTGGPSPTGSFGALHDSAAEVQRPPEI
jgi:hypothetical protein